jgi:hypothetical protein
VGRRAAFQLIVGVIALSAAGALLADVAGSWRFHDLWCFYHGGEAVLRGTDPYDAPAWLALTDDPSRLSGSRIVTAPCPGAFGYPYWSALAFAPLALLPYDVAAWVWGTLLISGIVGGVAFASRATRAPAPLVAVFTLGSLPLLQVLAFGQLTGVLLPLVGLSLLPPAGRAGASLALLMLKPQLVGVYAAALLIRALRRKDARFVLGFIAAAGLLVAASVALLPVWPLEWGREIVTNRLEIARPMPTAWGLSLLLFGNAIWGAIPVALLVAALLVLARDRVVGGVAFGAIVLAVSLFASPYVGGYDQLFLVLPWAVVLAAAARSEPPRRRALLGSVLAVAILLPWGLVVPRSGSDTLNALVPAITALLVMAVQPRRVRGGEVRTSAPPPLPV